jgi:hypothetical protein
MVVLRGELEKAEGELAALGREIDAVNRSLAGKKLPAIHLPSLEEWKKKDKESGPAAAGMPVALPGFF